MNIVISKAIEAKIGADDHDNITPKEVFECFENHDGRYCFDSRPQHLDDAGQPVPWFVAETNHRRALKITFVSEHGNNYLKSAYPATDDVKRIYSKYAK